MSGSSIGSNFKVTTWGESHGKAIGVVIDGCPAGLKITEKEIQNEVDQRKPIKNSSASTSRHEEDKIIILSGFFNGITTGTPISIMVENKNFKSEDYSKIAETFRPGHADLTYQLKYGIFDHRGGGRASGRETVARVIAGAIAKKILEDYCKKHKLKPIEIFGHTVQVGKIKAEKFVKSEISKNNLKCADKEKAALMNKLIEQVRSEKDSIGGIIEIIVENPIKGLGDPVFDKLEADLSKALMSIGAVKGVEIGDGFKVAEMKGSENNDQMQTINIERTSEKASNERRQENFDRQTRSEHKRAECPYSKKVLREQNTLSKSKQIQCSLGSKFSDNEADDVFSDVPKIEFLSNHSGGILGGISTGAPIRIRLAIKPVPSISKEQKSITTSGKNTIIKTLGRHDVCLTPRIIKVAESMVAIVLADKIR